jgi:hypothetical protein
VILKVFTYGQSDRNIEFDSRIFATSLYTRRRSKEEFKSKKKTFRGTPAYSKETWQFPLLNVFLDVIPSIVADLTSTTPHIITSEKIHCSVLKMEAVVSPKRR